MPRSRAFAQVDVFSAVPYGGNPVAVILDADGLGDQDMARIARWTNLSETTFVLPPGTPDADYRLRIFTPGGELPFAGHPTLGSAHAWLEHGGEPGTAGRIVQECAAGLVTLRHDDGALAFQAPPTIRSGELEPADLDRVIEALALRPDQVLAHQWVDNGPGWAVVVLPDAQAVLDLVPDLSRIPDLPLGAIGAYPAGSRSAFEIRAFVPGIGVTEDPVTGSLNASVAQWMLRTGAVSGSYRVSQGTVLGRTGEVEITCATDGEVWVGGATTTCFAGTAFA
ncbi:MAG: PhzF family phenazine biosynthesis protein [Micrococcus sp.]|nr:PhzF family phenazine biosynthesis protein [Micrococcus sp.]